MTKLDIGILTEIIDNHSGSRAPLEIAKHLAALNQIVTVYAFSNLLDKDAKEELENNNIKVILINKNKIPFLGKYLGAIKLLKILRKSKHDIMTYSAMFPFFMAGVLSGIPIVRIYQGTQFDAFLEKKIPGQNINLGDRFLNFIANSYIFVIEFITTQLADGVVAISNCSKEEAQRLYRKKVAAVIYHGTTILQKTNPKPVNKKYTFISVSRITPYKGFHLIINALKKLRDKNFSYVIVGTQPKPQYLEYLKRIGSPFVKIFLNVSDKNLAKIFLKSKIYLNADKYMYFGLTITEAGLYKIPAVSYNFKAAKEVIADQRSGFVVESEREFTQKIQQLLKDPSLLNKMGKEANRLAQNEFTWQKAAQKYLQVFEKILE